MRIPASYCGVYGFKPSYGMLSRWGVVSYADSLDTVGLLARELPDIARAFDVLAAEDPPGPLLSQLKIGGIMVVPVGQSDAVQTLIRVTRTETGFAYDEMRQVRFVPLVEGLGQT